MKKLPIILISVLIASCSDDSAIYEYQETSFVPDSLKENLRNDFISVIDYDNLHLAGDPDHDDDINVIYARIKDTYEVKVGVLKIIDSDIRYLKEHELGERFVPIYDSLKSRYYGN